MLCRHISVLILLMPFLFLSKAFISVAQRRLNRVKAMTAGLASRASVETPMRPSSKGVCLDTILIASNLELVLAHLRSRRASDELLTDVQQIAQLRDQRNALIKEGDKARGIRKTLSQQIGKLMKDGKVDEVDAIKKQVEDASEVAAKADFQLAVVDEDIDKLFSVIPNLLDDEIPDGEDESSNLVQFEWGTADRKIGRYLWHDEIAQRLGGYDNEMATRISGARFSVLKGPIARLERALGHYFLDFHTNRGYTEVSVPYIVSRSTLEGTGQLPKFEDDLFKVSHQVAGEDAFLIPTAEVPMTSLFRGELIDAEKLPMHLTCHSPSFRAEAGSHGRDTRGLLRQHQFHKVELIKIVAPETSEFEHQAMIADSEALLQALKLPYRKVLLCSGDIGFSARKCYDLEVWLPGQQEYREIASISNCHDFQARRMGLRFRTAKQGSGKKRATAFPHTLNGSGVAVGRALVAILENFQNDDGSITIPEPLVHYMGGMTTIPVSQA